MKRLILIVLAGTLLLGAAALIRREKTPQAVETMASAPEKDAPRDTGFVLGEYDGRVAVFGAGAEAPREITSIWVHYLPAADRNALKKGIDAANELALAALLEDLGS